MDPTACWHRYLDCLVEEELSDADDALSDLRYWLDRGGFPPHGFTYTEICKLVAHLPVRHT